MQKRLYLAELKKLTCYLGCGVTEERAGQAKLNRLDWSCLSIQKAAPYTLHILFIAKRQKAAQ